MARGNGSSPSTAEYTNCLRQAIKAPSHGRVAQLHTAIVRQQQLRPRQFQGYLGFALNTHFFAYLLHFTCLQMRIFLLTLKMAAMGAPRRFFIAEQVIQLSIQALVLPSAYRAEKP
jgi:hypothetical protein